MRFALIAGLLLASLAIAGCSSSPAASTVTVHDSDTAPASSAAQSSTGAASYAVGLFDNRYDPLTMTVPNFQKVVFTNHGSLSHTVTIVRQGDPPGTTLRDQPIQPGTSTDFNFPNSGTYTVYCRYHGSETSGMRMTITV